MICLTSRCTEPLPRAAVSTLLGFDLHFALRLFVRNPPRATWPENSATPNSRHLARSSASIRSSSFVMQSTEHRFDRGHHVMPSRKTWQG